MHCFVSFVWALAFTHCIKRMYAAAIWVQVPSRISPNILSYSSRAMLGQWDADTGRYTPSDQEVDEKMEQWGMEERDRPAVFFWVRKLAEQSWFACAVYFPLVWEGIAGVCLCLSTPESTRQSKYNGEVENQRRMHGILHPEWLQFEVWFYPGLVFGNFRDFGNPNARRVGLLGDVLYQLSMSARIPDFNNYVFVPPGAWVYGNLCRLLHTLGINLVAEVMSGISYRRLASLDVFVGIWYPAMGMNPPAMARWNAAFEPTDRIRQYPSQEYWWYMPVWRSEGQYEDGNHGNILDYQPDPSIPPHVQNVLATYNAHARMGNHGTNRRIAAMMGHIVGDVLPPRLPALGAMRDQGGMRPAGDLRRMLEDRDRTDSNL